MMDFLVKILGTFFVAGVTAAAGAIIEEVGNFGKNKIKTKPLTVQSWESFKNFGAVPKPVQTTPPPAFSPPPINTSYTAPVTSYTRPSYKIPESPAYKA
jgi:hypothetical protein